MRARLIMAIAAAGLGFGFSQPAAAGGWDDSCCCAGTVYVHHHVYAPVRYRHIYHVHTPGPRHINVVHPYAGRLLRARLRLSVLGLLRPALPLALARPALVSAAAATEQRVRLSPLTPYSCASPAAWLLEGRSPRGRRGGRRNWEAIAMRKTITRALLALTIVLGLGAAAEPPR